MMDTHGVRLPSIVLQMDSEKESQDGPIRERGLRCARSRRACDQAQLGFPVHPHMLRHACGFKLTNDGHDTRAIQHYLGRRNIQHTVRYTELAADRFKRFWTV